MLSLGFENGDLDHELFALRQELVQRRIDGPDRDGRALHRLEDAVEVVALHRQQLVERGAAIGFVVGQNHPLNDRNAALAEEHVLGSAEADAARAKRVGGLGLIGLIGVGADAEAAELVGPFQQLVEALENRRLARLHLAGDDLQDLARLRRHLGELHLAGQPVKGDVVALANRLSLHADALAVLVDHELAGADNRRLSHLPADDGRV